MTNKFKPFSITSPSQLEEVVKTGLESKANHYYLLLNEWDKDSKTLAKYIDSLGSDGNLVVNVVSIFDVPNAIQVIRSAIKEEKENMSTTALLNGIPVPSLIVLHGAFPRVVTYPGSFYSELGL